MLVTYRCFLFSLIIMTRKNIAMTVKITMRTANTMTAIISSTSSTRVRIVKRSIQLADRDSYLLILPLRIPPIPAMLGKIAVTSLGLLRFYN